MTLQELPFFLWFLDFFSVASPYKWFERFEGEREGMKGMREQGCSYIYM